MAKVITTELQHSGASGANITLDSSKNVTCENNLTVDGTTTLTGAVELPDDTVDIADLSATGTASGTTYLRGDNTWATISTQDTLSYRNKIINGAMQISQRHGTSAYAYDSSGKKFTTDRWGLSRSGMTFDVTATQSTDAPAGFHNSLKIEADTTQTPGANEVGVINYDIEGQDLQDLEFGHSSAKDITVSFWCKVSANAVGDYSLQLMYTKESDNSGRSVWKKFTPTTSWARYTLTFPGTGSATSDHIKVSDSYTGMYLYMFLCAGSGKLAAETDTWAAQGDYRAHTTQTNFLDSADNEFYITGVQFEKGSTATDYEHKTYAQELRACQRYYWGWTAPGTTIGVCNAMARTSDLFMSVLRHPVEMRASPTLITSTTAGHHEAVWQNAQGDINASGITTPGGTYLREYSYPIAGTLNSGSYGTSSLFIQLNGAGTLAFDAEL